MKENALNVFNEPLLLCGTSPMTGAYSGKSMYIDPCSPAHRDLASPIFNDPSSPSPFNPQEVFKFK
jgi:hypothetical protein